MSDAYKMFQRCWDHQPDNTSHDQDLYALMVAEHMISREPITYSGEVLPEERSMYPGTYTWLVPEEGVSLG